MPQPHLITDDASARSRRPRRHPFAPLLVAWLALVLGLGAALGRSVSASLAASVRPPDPDTEYSVKAAFLYNFLRYTTWPKESFEKEDSPICLTVLGKDPFGEILDEALKDKVIGKRRVVITREKTLPKDCGAHIVFACEIGDKQQEELIEKLGKKPVLLIGETPGFAEAGGTINFFLDKAHIKFEINAGAAKRAGLSISSQLLKLAKIVETKKKGGDEQ